MMRQHTKNPSIVSGFTIEILLADLFLLSPLPALAERKTVAAQIQLPHNYYYREMYLPQLTSRPSAFRIGHMIASLAGWMHATVRSLRSPVPLNLCF